MNANGANLRQIDGYLPQCSCHTYFDVSANGETVALTDSVQIRVASSNSGEGRQLLTLGSNEINGLRISGDGRTIVFRVYRDTSFAGESGTDPISRGLYAIDADGSNLRRLVGPEEMAPRLNVTPEEVPFFGGTWGLDLSFDGGVIAFVSLITPEAGGSGQGLFVTSLNGGVPRMLLARTAFVTSGAVSPDGSTIAYVSYDNAIGLAQVGIVAPNGFGQRVLTDDSRETGIGMGLPSGERIQLSTDGTRLILGSTGLLLDTATGAKLAFSVNDFMSVSGDPPSLLNGTTYRSSMSADAARAIYLLADERGVLQLVRMDVNPASLDGAPEVANASADPPFVLPQTASLSTATVDVATENAFVRVGVATLRDGMPDPGVSGAYYGPLLDDGASNGDAVAGDGTYTTDKIASDCCTPEGPRTLRFRAETQDGNGLRSATTVDVRPFAVGSAAPEPTAVAEPTAGPTDEPKANEAAGPIDLDKWTGQPDPADCVTEQLIAREFVTALAKAIDSPPEFTVPQLVASIDELPAGGPVADDADALAALETLNEAGACINAGDFPALLALFTPVGLARAAIVSFGGIGVAEPIDAARQAEIIAELEPNFATPIPPTSDADRAIIDHIVEIRSIEDGRIMIVMEGVSPIVSGLAAFFLQEQDGRWLIDETCAIGEGSTIGPPIV
jgi:Tol biopolymer transport system component